MREILVISGKGGTGKTSITACFGALADASVLVDCDVDAANMHLLLSPEKNRQEDFYSGFEAVVTNENCTSCGKCLLLCRFDAISQVGSGDGNPVTIDPLACEGCGVCVDHCPEKAITLQARLCGQLMVSRTRLGTLVHARLGAGGENSGKLVTAVRGRARTLAAEQKSDLVLIDGPPGIGCAVIASATGCDYAVIVTEPTVSGEHDLRRVVQLLKHFDIPAGVVINKSDLNPEVARSIHEFTRDKGLDVLGEVPYDDIFTEAQRAARIVLEHEPGSLVSGRIEEIWRKVEGVILNGGEKRP